MQIVIFEDKQNDNLNPINLTKPCSRILIAGTYLEEVIKRVFGQPQYQGREYLFDKINLENDVLFINSCLVPDIKRIIELKKLTKDSKFMIKKNNRVIICRGEFGKEVELTYDLDLIEYPWDPIIYNKKLLNDNLKFISKHFKKIKKNVFIGKNVKIKNCKFNTQHGIIVIDNNTKIENFVSIHGPCYIGKNSHIKEFTFLAHSSIGDVCKIRGEVESSIINSYTNNQHYGFMGHSLLGSWVNIGAGTANSDLKNTYGNINIKLNGKKIDTKQQFLGCIVGDYSKTAINATIFTGKIIGVNSFLYGTIKHNVPSFVSHENGKNTEFYLDSAIKVQKRIFERRNLKQTNKDINILKKVFELTKKERKK